MGSKTRCYPAGLMDHLVRYGMIALLLAACSGGGSTTSGDGADCAAMSPGLEQDKCLHEEIKALPVAQADVVLTKAQQISDPMVRGAAVSGWMAEHNADVPQQQGNALCQLLDGRDRSYCQRLLSSPHLQR